MLCIPKVLFLKVRYRRMIMNSHLNDYSGISDELLGDC
jgi:hypothetical protein